MDLKKAGIKYGLIAGVLTLLVYFGAYFYDKLTYYHPTVSIITWIIYLAGMWKASSENLKGYTAHYGTQEGASFSFTHALQAPFLVFLIAQVFYYAQYWLMFNLIDTSMIEIARTYSLETLEASREVFSRFLDEATIDERIEMAKNQDYGVTIRSAFFNFSRSLIGGFIVAAIFALFFKKSTL